MKRYCLLLTAFALAVPLVAGTIVVPNSLAATETNVGANLNANARVQQVFASNQFGASAITITSIALRDEGGAAASSQNVNSFFLRMAVTSNAPDALSTTFASNLGSNVQTVFNGPITLTTAACASGPCPFDMVIPLQSSYAYNPGSGNLLLDFTWDTQPWTNLMEVANANGDSVSSIDGNSAATTGTANTVGLVVQFTTATGVPEPGTGILAGLGLLAAAGVRRWRR